MELNLSEVSKEKDVSSNGKSKGLEERLKLLRLLRANDSLLFEYADRKPEYFHVLSVLEDGWVRGNYIDSDGKVATKSLSLRYIAERNPRVAQYQQITQQ